MSMSDCHIIGSQRKLRHTHTLAGVGLHPSYFCSAECQKTAWKRHKKTCKAPTGVAASEAELRSLHKGILLLNRCIQEPGAGDGPTSVA